MLDTTQSPPIAAAVGVVRSRTLPSRKKGGGDDTLGLGMESSVRREKGTEKRVLKKQRRVSGGGMTGTATTTLSPTPNLNLNSNNLNTSTSTNMVNRTLEG